MCTACNKREAGGAVSIKDAVNFIITRLEEGGWSVLILREKPFSVRKQLYILTHRKRSLCASGLAGEIGTSSPAS